MIVKSMFMHHKYINTVPYNSNIISAFGELLGTPDSPFDYNVVGNDERESLKTKGIGQSAAKGPDYLVQGSTTRAKTRRIQVDSKCRSTCLKQVQDIVWSLLKGKEFQRKRLKRNITGLENIMVAEDKALRNLSLTAATGRNDAFLFNVFTPTVFASMVQQVRRWGIPCTNMLLAFDLWTDKFTICN